MPPDSDSTTATFEGYTEVKTGRIEIHSNGGIAAVTVDISVEVPEAALGRFKTGLFWAGFLPGGLLSYTLYESLPNHYSKPPPRRARKSYRAASKTIAALGILRS